MRHQKNTLSTFVDFATVFSSAVGSGDRNYIVDSDNALEELYGSSDAGPQEFAAVCAVAREATPRFQVATNAGSAVMAHDFATNAGSAVMGAFNIAAGAASIKPSPPLDATASRLDVVFGEGGVKATCDAADSNELVDLHGYSYAGLHKFGADFILERSVPSRLHNAVGVGAALTNAEAGLGFATQSIAASNSATDFGEDSYSDAVDAGAAHGFAEGGDYDAGLDGERAAPLSSLDAREQFSSFSPPFGCAWVWRLNLRPRESIFWWRILLNAILTRE